jgi:hypothetical protein
MIFSIIHLNCRQRYKKVSERRKILAKYLQEWRKSVTFADDKLKREDEC